MFLNDKKIGLIRNFLQKSMPSEQNENWKGTKRTRASTDDCDAEDSQVKTKDIATYFNVLQSMK
jgi:hypothetical protein